MAEHGLRRTTITRRLTGSVVVFGLIGASMIALASQAQARVTPYASDGIAITSPVADQVIEGNAQISATGTVSPTFGSSTVRVLISTNDNNLDFLNLTDEVIDVPIDAATNTWTATLSAPTYGDGSVATGDFYIQAKLPGSQVSASTPIEIAKSGTAAIDSPTQGQQITDADVTDGWLAVVGHVNEDALKKHPNLTMGVWTDRGPSQGDSTHPQRAVVDPQTGTFTLYYRSTALAQGQNKIWVGNTDYSVFAQISVQVDLTSSATIDEPTGSDAEGPEILLSGTVSNPDQSDKAASKDPDRVGISVDGKTLTDSNGRPINVIGSAQRVGESALLRWNAAFGLADINPNSEHTVHLFGTSRGRPIDVTRQITVDGSPTLTFTSRVDGTTVPKTSDSIFLSVHATNYNYQTGHPSPIVYGVDAPAPTTLTEFNHSNLYLRMSSTASSARNDYSDNLRTTSLKPGIHTVFVSMLDNAGNIITKKATFTFEGATQPAEQSPISQPVPPTTPQDASSAPTKPTIKVESGPAKRVRKHATLKTSLRTSPDVRLVRLYDGKKLVGTAVNKGGHWTLKWKATTRGNHTYRVEAVNFAGGTNVLTLARVVVR